MRVRPSLWHLPGLAGRSLHAHCAWTNTITWPGAHLVTLARVWVLSMCPVAIGHSKPVAGSLGLSNQMPSPSRSVMAQQLDLISSRAESSQRTSSASSKKKKAFLTFNLYSVLQSLLGYLVHSQISILLYGWIVNRTFGCTHSKKVIKLRFPGGS